VTEASVSVDGEVLGQIGPGLVVLVGIARADGDRHIEYIVSKTVNLRIFEDDEGRFNLSALDVEADLLVISQFTLYADTRRGRRPGFTEAAPPDTASDLFETTLARFEESGLHVETGRFQAHMHVEIHNDGPVTIMLDTADRGL
jgi:D-tyrosyl-tRNA(Tyr) deacylase